MQRLRSTVYALFFFSGASALVFQTGWQRVVSLHAGMDLFSVTTVIAAFMAGLGIGSVVGGWGADRVPPAIAVLTYALAEIGVGAFGWASVWLLYWKYPLFSSLASGTWGAFGVHFGLLILPTFLMGSTLPLLSRGVVREEAEIAPLSSKLYAANTVGAAAGCLAMSNWWILGSIGLESTVRAAATINLACGLAGLFLAWRAKSAAVSSREGPKPPSVAPLDTLSKGTATWIAIYGLTGFVALGLEVVWFRLLNVLMTSTTYTFARLLGIYLVFLGLGVYVGSRRWATRVNRPDRLFLLLQFAVGLTAIVFPLIVVLYMSKYGLSYRRPFRNIVAPALVLPIPTLLMGMSFPLIQRLVNQRLESVGRRIGMVLFVNTLGCVAGTFATGFFLLDKLGTPATLRLFSVVLALLGAGAALRMNNRWRWPAAIAGVAAVAVLALALPSGNRFWAPLHGARAKDADVVEDGTCVTAMVERTPGHFRLYISGELQNGVPFDDFHLRLGALPVLLHPDPKEVLVIGLGAGSTAYGIGLDPRVQTFETVEICAGEVPLLRRLGAQGMPELQQLFADPRLRVIIDDGRKYLVDTNKRYDLIVSDPLLSLSPYSGSLYSMEFYQLVHSRLKPGGMFAQWISSERAMQSAAAVFEQITDIRAQHLPPGDDPFFVASNAPFEVNRALLAQRYAAARRKDIRLESEPRLAAFVQNILAFPVDRTGWGDISKLNRDLFARDEYAQW
jgi:predicted membrane-bound spermidine synthase